MNLGSVGMPFRHLSMQQRIVVALAAVAALAAFVGILRIASAPNMALLYAGLDPAAAGEVIQSLEQQGAIHEVRGGAIYVDASQRDTLRMTLAAEGKPASGSAGYELLDTLTGFGTTSQMFDAAYWRAKEGELARTIMSSPLIRSARVHISAAGSRPFARSAEPSASVSIIPVSGGITTEQAAAIRHLVSSAVAGLAPEDVTVVDGRAGRIISADGESPLLAGDQRAEEMRRRAERLLEARVGPGNALVEVAIETVSESEQITERRLDPEGRVLISTEVEERTNTSTDLRPGNVTVASNLPDGDASGDGQQSSSDDSETRERSNFDVSETTREVVRLPGAIERVTVAVLVNDANPSGGEAVPRGQEELAALRELVASAVGLNEARGDQITVQAMSFTLPESVEGATYGLIDRLVANLDLGRLIQLGVLALVALVLGLFVVRPIMMRPPPSSPELFPGRITHDLTAPQLLPAQNVPALPTPQLRTSSTDSAQKLVRAMETHRTDAAAVLKTWIRAPEGSA